MFELARFLNRIFDDFPGMGRLRQLPRMDRAWPGLNNLFNFLADLAEIDVQVLQDVGSNPVAFLGEPQEDVLGADVLIIEPLRLLIG